MLSRAVAIARPAARQATWAFKPATVSALRTFTASSQVASSHGDPPPQLLGPGVKPGEVPTSYDQATGIERLQLLGDIEGFNVFDQEPLDSSRTGTKANPILVPATAAARIVGCTGSPADSHDVLWFEVKKDKLARCAECGSVYALQLEEGYEEALAHAHAH
ncbi:cytochrome c oxidase subunit VB-domain-containing protein [Armillaria borealis]|uniref:Cytochrome c oxidase subunit VB-domain-containing protein n=1 Tax=Armillaria borealis TaxID=47425 RepID=A0AA39MTS8_9AGAR|nr:cytochrome c oxidase subunit VB-domain-containing protein [Armillaria nabsnona]KAK0446342.1 cytochrome c oxidase subunit VB-domain-containing protein [Armillaria borealis]